MKTETIKSIDSYLASIKSDLLANMTDEEALQYVKWSQHKLSQTIKDRKEKKILADIKKLNPTTDGQAISKKSQEKIFAFKLSIQFRNWRYCVCEFRVWLLQ